MRQVRQAGVHVTVVDIQRPTAAKRVCASKRAAAGVDGLQRGEEAGDVTGETLRVGDAVTEGKLTGQPAVQRPGPREPAAWNTLQDGYGYGDWQLRGEHRQPLVLLGYGRHIAVVSGHTGKVAVPDAEGTVVPPVDLDRLDGLAGQPGGLLLHQAGDHVRGDFVLLHVLPMVMTRRGCRNGFRSRGSRVDTRAVAPHPRLLERLFPSPNVS